jgi:hypothetical protein
MNSKAYARMMSRVEKTATCWLWTGPLGRGGYAYFTWREPRTEKFVPAPVQGVRVHRAVYEHEVGPIPEGMTLDHLCRVRHCVNPDHMEIATHRTNILRGETLAAANARKTHCPKGHPYDGDNLMTTKSGGRACKECNRVRCRRVYHARKKRDGATA